MYKQVTGASGGIGFYVAKLLCRVGLTVLLPLLALLAPDLAGPADPADLAGPACPAAVPRWA
jgi:NAD(P)-dependent dehydrogenase (short-subunit alcohol dehydrogenase family)